MADLDKIGGLPVSSVFNLVLHLIPLCSPYRLSHTDPSFVREQFLSFYKIRRASRPFQFKIVNQA